MSLPGFDIEGLTSKALRAKDGLLAGLQGHGKDDPVKSAAIEKALKLSGPEVRALVSHLRCQGEPIGSNGRGYHWCQTPEEVQATRDHIRGRRQRLDRVDQGLERAQTQMRCGRQHQSRLDL